MVIVLTLKKAIYFMTFESLNLDPRILKAIEEAGFQAPTPIQEKAIPEILQGADLRASAQTGTGKTAAFLLPICQLLTKPSPVKGYGPRALILVPTRELAMQIAKEAERYTKYLPKAKTVCIYGGAPYPVQNRQLSRPYDILVVTPGRLIDHLHRGRIDFSRIEVMVLDEADRMLDMGFIEAVEEIAAATPSTRQTLLFSATLKGQVLNLSKRLMRDPKEVCVIPTDEKYDHIKQEFFYVDHLSHKLNLLKELLNDEAINQAIIFTSTKRYAEELAQELRDSGHHASALHGDMNQSQRARTLSSLRSGNLRLLIATDVAARGIDVSTISHVFNFDLPRCVEDYTHRIGRTGRAGASGVAFSFATPKERHLMRQIEVFIEQKLNPQFVANKDQGSEKRGAPRRSNQRRFGSPKPAFGSKDAKRQPFFSGRQDKPKQYARVKP